MWLIVTFGKTVKLVGMYIIFGANRSIIMLASGSWIKTFNGKKWVSYKDNSVKPRENQDLKRSLALLGQNSFLGANGTNHSIGRNP